MTLDFRYDGPGGLSEEGYEYWNSVVDPNNFYYSEHNAIYYSTTLGNEPRWIVKSDSGYFTYIASNDVCPPVGVNYWSRDPQNDPMTVICIDDLEPFTIPPSE